MRLMSKICSGMVSLGLAIGLTGVLSGCDPSESQKNEYRPIQTDILKKLGSASQGQSDAVKSEHPSKAKKKR
jgi:hypothetical protein